MVDEWRARAAERAYHKGVRLTVGELAEQYLDCELARSNEVCTITAGDVYETNEGLELRLRYHKTKKHAGRERVIPLNDRAAEIVQQALLDGRSTDPNRWLFTTTTQKPITSNELYQAIRRAARHAGLPHWTAYQLRHLGATEMLDAGCSEAEASTMIGHTPGSTVVRRYSKDRVRLARRASKGIGAREAV